MAKSLEVRSLGRDELSRVRDIDRTERIDVLVELHGDALLERRGTRDVPAWDRDAQRVGDTEIVVTATPSGDTVRFHLRHGYQTMAQPLPGLLELEPHDVHTAKSIRAPAPRPPLANVRRCGTVAACSTPT